MNCLHRWRKWIRPLIITLYVIIICIVLPLLIVELYKKDAPSHVKGWFVAGVFTLLSLPISFWGILQHLVYFTKPVLQKNIIRILWMVPVYALNAWLALLFPSAAIYLDTIRECYEAYVIYNFMSYLLNYLRIEHPYLEYDLENKAQVKHFFPFCFLPPWTMGRQFVQRCKHGVLQYTIVRPLTTIIALGCEFGNVYDEGDFNFSTAWSYLVIINNISQIWAMYCLVLFYRLTKEELQPIKPVPKFMCVKAVVFLSFWQAVLIAALAKLGAIPKNGPWLFYHSVKEVATGLQDFCICIEMFFAAIAHYFSFSHKPYMDMAADRSNCCSSFLSMWDVSDVHNDVLEHARFIGNGVQKRLRKKFRSSADETKPLLSDNQPPERSAQQVMEQSGSHQYNRPNTPPVVVHDDFMASMKSETQTDWDGSSIDQRDNFINQRQGTASLNNFVDFGSSVESSNIKEYERQSLNVKPDTPKEEKLIDFDVQETDNVLEVSRVNLGEQHNIDDNKGEQPVGDNREQPEGDNSEKPKGDNSEQPKGDNIEQPEGDNSKQPRGDNIEQPEGDNSKQPRGDNIEQQEEDNSEQTKGDNTEQPKGDNIKQPEGDNSEQPNGDNSEQPEGDNSEQTEGDKSEQSESDTKLDII